MRDVRLRFWVEAVLFFVSGALLIVTLAWHNWIEIVLGVDPDRGSGWAEWLVVVLAVTSAAASSLSAHREWRRGLTLRATARHVVG
jgi:hypothetical protein